MITTSHHDAAPSHQGEPRPRGLLPVIGGGVAGLALAAGYALHPLWWAPWLAPVILLGVCRTERDARIAGAAAGLLAMVGVVSYYLDLMGPGPALVITALRVASWTFSARLAIAAGRKLSFVDGVLTLPISQAALEMIALTASPHGAAGSLAYSQMAHPVLVQIAAVGGVPAVVFLVLLPGSLIGLSIALRPARRSRTLAGALVGLMVLSVAGFTLHRSNMTASAPTITVAAIATDRFKGIPTDWSRVWSVYRPAVLAGAGGASLTVLPEKIVLIAADAERRVAADVAIAARQVNSTVVLGVEVRDALGFRNRALAVAPGGRATWYDKQRLVPGFEDRDRPGVTPVNVSVAGLSAGLAVCKDMHVPTIGRQYARSGVMAVPAWDFGDDAWMGARMTAMRAVENGYAVVRSARRGYLSVFGSTGAVIAEQLTRDSVTVVRAEVPIGTGSTPYGRIGDVFGWACVAVMTMIVASTTLARRRSRLTKL